MTSGHTRNQEVVACKNLLQNTTYGNPFVHDNDKYF